MNNKNYTKNSASQRKLRNNRQDSEKDGALSHPKCL